MQNGIYAVLTRLMQLLGSKQLIAPTSLSPVQCTHTGNLVSQPDIIHVHWTPLAGQASAVEVLQRCGARLCALGADGEVLQKAGLTLHVSPKEVRVWLISVSATALPAALLHKDAINSCVEAAHAGCC
jgi:hypothetical protein